MSNFQHAKKWSEFQTETIEVDAENSISFSQGRGGIITSLRLDGTNILYMDETSFLDPSKNVRGGIPILFPNFGPVKSMDYPDLPQHGVARISNKWQAEKKPDGFSEILDAVERDQRYPYLYSLELAARLSDNSCTITEQATNNEPGRELPISMGLHPYFHIPYSLRTKITFDFKDGILVREQMSKWASNRTITFIDNPGAMKIHIPSVGTLELEASPEYQKIAFWALPDADFLCIEPVMRVIGGLVDDPILIPSNSSFSANFKIEFKKAA
jgi:D-hexose-6-phosphate mutarotase